MSTIEPPNSQAAPQRPRRRSILVVCAAFVITNALAAGLPLAVVAVWHVPAISVNLPTAVSVLVAICTGAWALVGRRTVVVVMQPEQLRARSEGPAAAVDGVNADG